MYSSAKICQSGEKALMTNPNIELCDSLLTLLNPSYLQNALNNETNVLPITYDDLLRVGYDSVTIVKSKENDNTYVMYLSEIGTFEIFLNDLLLDKKSA